MSREISLIIIVTVENTTNYLLDILPLLIQEALKHIWAQNKCS